MLVELHVENFAVVERLRLRFHTGLNLLTGETGSGKSIIVDSLGLLFGGRASADVVRTGTERARISGVFSVPQAPAFRALLEEAGIRPQLVVGTSAGSLVAALYASGKTSAAITPACSR